MPEGPPLPPLSSALISHLIWSLVISAGQIKRSSRTSPLPLSTRRVHALQTHLRGRTNNPQSEAAFHCCDRRTRATDVHFTGSLRSFYVHFTSLDCSHVGFFLFLSFFLFPQESGNKGEKKRFSCHSKMKKGAGSDLNKGTPCMATGKWNKTFHGSNL